MAKTKLSSYIQHHYGMDYVSFTGADNLKHLQECTWHSPYSLNFVEGDVVLVKGTAEKSFLLGGKEVVISAPAMKLALMGNTDVPEQETCTVRPFEKTGLESIESIQTLKRAEVYALPSFSLHKNMCIRGNVLAAQGVSTSLSSQIGTSSVRVVGHGNAHSEPVVTSATA